MSDKALPLVISAPEPRTLDLIFTPPQLARLRKHYRIVEAAPLHRVAPTGIGLHGFDFCDFHRLPRRMI